MEKEQLAKLLEGMHKAAYLWSRQCCHYDDDMAREVLQTVYLKIFEERARYHEKSSFQTWLFSVIRYTAIDILKKRTVYNDLEAALAVPVHDADEDTTDYRKMLRQLPEQQAHVLLLAFYHDMTLEAISVVMDISIGTVRTHYERGKKRLKTLIEKTKLQDYEG